MRVALFAPCFVDAFRPSAAEATVRVLARLGVGLEFPAEQTCCGQPHFNAGRWEDARRLAERFCRIFERFDAVVTPSGSCAAMVRRHYATLLGEPPIRERVWELSEFVVGRLGRAEAGGRLAGRAALHVGCHHRRALGGAPAAETLLAGVAGLTPVCTESDAWCCGFGGAFAVKFPELSCELGRRKLAPVERAGVDWLVATDPSCLLHLEGLQRRGDRPGPRLLHLAEVLAADGEPP